MILMSTLMIFRILTCVCHKERPLVLVEYAPHGDLLGYLRKSRGVQDNYYSDPSVKPHTSITSKGLLKFSWEICDGMAYLSSKKVKTELFKTVHNDPCYLCPLNTLCM